MNLETEPRCTECNAMLVHAGAICVVCDDRTHYEAPIRTSPPLQLPDRDDDEITTDRAIARFTRRRVS